MEPEHTPSFMPQLAQRFQALVWACINADLTRTAIFYAERYFAMEPHSHDARHLYATALIRHGQIYSALCQIDIPRDEQCSGCLDIKARCSAALGRHRQAREAMEECMHDVTYASSSSSPPKYPHQLSEEAFLHCRSGSMAFKGNLPEKASASFRQALVLNPLLWEAFEGLCALGSVPEIDEILPPRPLPVKPTKRAPPEDNRSKPGVPTMPVPSGVGFFTPEAGPSGALFRSWKPESNHLQAFRLSSLTQPRDSIGTNDSFSPADTTFQRNQGLRPTGSTQPHVSRPLSSADEAGPVPKKLRSTGRLPEVIKSSKLNKLAFDDPSKKASSSRNSATAGKPTGGMAGSGTRRSTRLLSGAGLKQHAFKSSPRDRRRPAQERSRSIDSEFDEDGFSPGEAAYPPSPPSNAHSPRSERSASPVNGASNREQELQEAFEMEQVEYYLYDLVRKFASATRSLTFYDSQRCIADLEQLPSCHQKTPWVVSMVGKAHYANLDYSSAERAFKALRSLDPARLWDMEIYSTLLWHLQRPVELSFLAQELLNIDPKSAEAWIAIGNLFSLQRERPQALTCFRRATQMDPSCAYAYTLSGHESIDDDLEKAVNFFQRALHVDARHYNAWYGLGTCYLRQSKIRLAEYHFRKASEIHPTNAVLLGCVGLTLERRGDRTGALAIFTEACRLSPKNALTRFRRAKILTAQKRYHEAIEDLEYLRSHTPDETNVIFQLAKVYRLVGDEVKSAQLLAIARDIAPKSLQKIKKLLDTVKDEPGDDNMDEG